MRSYSLLASRSVNDASLGMPIKSYCYELNLYDLFRQKASLPIAPKTTVSTQSILKLHSRLSGVCLP